jgi:hypothetical protein
MTALLVIAAVACAWAAVAVAVLGLCVLAARGDRAQRAGRPAPLDRPTGTPQRLRLIA